MHYATKASLAGLFALSTVAVAPAAWAGCGEIVGRQPASWQQNPGSGYFMHADYDGPSFAEAGNRFASAGANSRDGLLVQADYTSSSIVGMWAVKFFVGNTQFDFGYAQWHSDGTELLNSGGRAPSTENFCMGVWQQSGAGRYHLNHFALSYDTSGTLNAKINIKEDVTLGKNGATYSGPFTIDVYDPSSGALLNHVAGQVIGQRVAAY